VSPADVVILCPSHVRPAQFRGGVGGDQWAVLAGGSASRRNSGHGLLVRLPDLEPRMHFLAGHGGALRGAGHHLQLEALQLHADGGEPQAIAGPQLRRRGGFWWDCRADSQLWKGF